MFVSREDFNEWAQKMKEDFVCNYQRYRSIAEGRMIIVVDKKNGKVGIARCHPDDEFNTRIGLAIAYARVRGIDIPNVGEWVATKNLKNGDVIHVPINGKNTLAYYIGKHPTKNDYHIVMKAETERLKDVALKSNEVFVIY